MVFLAIIVVQFRVNELVGWFCAKNPITSEVPDKLIISIGSSRDECGLNNIGYVHVNGVLYGVEVQFPIKMYGVNF